MNATTKTNSAPSQAHGNRSAALAAGTTAPDFELKSTPDQNVRLSEFRGRPVVLAFYPAVLVQHKRIWLKVKLQGVCRRPQKIARNSRKPARLGFLKPFSRRRYRKSGQ